MPGRSVAVAVEPVEWLVAAKFHALFKVRCTDVVSSRCRDLFDLALALPAIRQETVEAAITNLSYIDTTLDLGNRLPPEWLPEWSRLNSCANTSLDIYTSWSELVDLLEGSSRG